MPIFLNPALSNLQVKVQMFWHCFDIDMWSWIRINLETANITWTNRKQQKPSETTNSIVPYVNSAKHLLYTQYQMGVPAVHAQSM